jgi:hypothetical protein
LRDVREVYFDGVRLRRAALLSTSPGDWMPRAGVRVE